MAATLDTAANEPAAAQPAPAAAQSGGNQPRGMPPVMQIVGFFGMVLGMFMAILDIQIVSSSIAEIQAGLAASSDEVSWVQTSYLIAEVVMIPLSGFLSRLLSTRILFLSSAIGFTLMSLCCALAWDINSMIMFRALQGFVGGAMIPTVFATSFILFPPKSRAGISVLMGLVATMAPTIGPTLGGYLTQTLSWHWLFLINIVPGILVVSVVWRTVNIDKPNLNLMKRFDVFGLLAMAVFLGALEYVLEEGPQNDWLADEAVRACAVASAVGAVAFFWRVLTYDQPIVDITAFKDRNFAIGSLYSFILGIGLYGSVYLMPLFLGRVRGYNSLQIGLVMIVTGLFQFMSAPIAGALAKKLDSRVMLAIGLGLFGTGVYLTSFLTNQASFWELFVPQAVRGLALMLCFIPINTMALGTLAPEKVKNASGLYNLMRNLGGAIGLALLNTLLHDRLNLHWRRLADQITASRANVVDTLNGLSAKLGAVLPGTEDLGAMKRISAMVLREAQVMSFNDAFLVMAAVFFSAILLMPLVRKPKPMGGPSADAH